MEYIKRRPGLSESISQMIRAGQRKLAYVISKQCWTVELKAFFHLRDERLLKKP